MQNKKLSLVMTAGVIVDLLPDDKHKFLMTTQDVAKGYNVTPALIQDCMHHHAIEFVANKHFLSHSTEDGVMWTKRGVVRLGLFINGPKVRRSFWDMIEGLKLSATPESLDTFTFDDKHPVRVEMIDREPWFVAVDVCNVLGLQNPSDRLKKTLDSNEYLTYLLDRSGQQRLVNMVNESGLYSLVFQSRKPQAKVFRKWVTSEVLPAIRRTGKYTPEVVENDCPYTQGLPDMSNPEPCPQISTIWLLEMMHGICKIENAEVRSYLADKLVEAMPNVDVLATKYSCCDMQ
jgi:prophage antirepressor-like protein